jgi:hypothetical protein
MTFTVTILKWEACIFKRETCLRWEAGFGRTIAIFARDASVSRRPFLKVTKAISLR